MVAAREKESVPLHRSHSLILGLAIVLLLALGYVDHVTAAEFDLFLFYALPVALGAWWVGRGAALCLATGAVAVWFVADILWSNPYSTLFYTAWNTALRGGWVLIVALTIAALRDAYRSMEQRVQARTADPAQTVRTLETQRAQLRRLTDELVVAEQRERSRLASVLHDELQPILVAARFRLEALAPAEGGAIRDRCLEIAAVIQQALASTRATARDLSPIAVADGLRLTMDWLVRQMAERHQLTIDLHAPAEIPCENDTVRLLVFETVRELLFNVVKHAGVLQACLEILPAPDELRIVVSDAGAGFDPARPPTQSETGLGLPRLRERLARLGGTLEITSAVGQGCRSVLSFPRHCLAAEAPPVDGRGTARG